MFEELGETIFGAPLGSGLVLESTNAMHYMHYSCNLKKT